MDVTVQAVVEELSRETRAQAATVQAAVAEELQHQADVCCALLRDLGAAPDQAAGKAVLRELRRQATGLLDWDGIVEAAAVLLDLLPEASKEN